MKQPSGINVLEEIGLKGVHPFKEVRFPILPGITAIYGLNRAGGKASTNSNGVGKSALLSLIPEIIHDTPIVGEKQDRVKEGVRALKWTSYTGQKILVKRSAVGRGEKIQVFVDGEDKQFRTPTIARAFIQKMFPLTTEDYNTYCHIDARIPHPLVMGSSAERKRFFTSFFRLDRFDNERKLFNAELQQLSRIRVAFNELRAQYNKTKEDLLTEEQLENYLTLQKKYRHQLEVLQRRFTKVQGVLQLLQYARSAKEQLAELKIACNGTLNQEEFDEAEKQNNYEYKDVQKKIEDAEEWELYQRMNAAYTEARAALSKGALAFIKKHGTVRNALAAAEEDLNSIRRIKSAIERWRSEIKELQDLEEPEAVKKPEGYGQDVGDLETLQRAYSHQLDHAEKFQEGKCDSCGQIVKIKDPKALKRKLDEVTLKIRQHDDYREYLKYKKEYDKTVFKLRAYKRNLQREKDKLADYEITIEVYREIRDLPSKPARFEGQKLQIKVLRRMREEIYARRTLLASLKPHLESIFDYVALTPEQKKQATDSQGLATRMSDVQHKLSRITAKIEVHNTISERSGEMRKRLIEMKKELKEEEPLKHLIAGYQDKNIKKAAVEAISERLMTTINQYAAMIFPENFTFSFEWGSQISLLVHRHYAKGKPPKTSDVRRLSGAESKLFTIVLVLALLTFVPSRKRCSLLVLDEPTANMSAENAASFRELLPVLNKFIPSIVVITPHSKEVYEGAHVFTVVKSATGLSTIEKGFPQAQNAPRMKRAA